MGKRSLSVARFIKKLEREQERIAQSRDRLRDLIDDAEAVLSDCNDAEEALSDAVDALSRLQ